MSQGLLSSNPLFRIEFQQPAEQIHSMLTRVGEKLRNVLIFSEWDVFRVAKRLPAYCHTSCARFRFEGGRDSSIVAAKGDCIESTSSPVGLPVTFKTNDACQRRKRSDGNRKLICRAYLHDSV